MSGANLTSTSTSYAMSIDLVRSALASKGSVNTRVKKSPTNGWPSQRIECPKELWDYWNHRCDLALEDSLILKGDRIDRICEDRFWI